IAADAVRENGADKDAPRVASGHEQSTASQEAARQAGNDADGERKDQASQSSGEGGRRRRGRRGGRRRRRNSAGAAAGGGDDAGGNASAGDAVADDADVAPAQRSQPEFDFDEATTPTPAPAEDAPPGMPAPGSVPGLFDSLPAPRAPESPAEAAADTGPGEG